MAFCCSTNLLVIFIIAGNAAATALCYVSLKIRGLMSDTNWMLFSPSRKVEGNWGKPNEQSLPWSVTWHQWLVTVQGGDASPRVLPSSMWHDPDCHGPSVPATGLSTILPTHHLLEFPVAFNHHDLHVVLLSGSLSVSCFSLVFLQKHSSCTLHSPYGHKRPAYQWERDTVVQLSIINSRLTI